MIELPIHELRDQVVSALHGDRVRLLVEAPTGSGKSTQVPQMLADSGVCDAGEVWVLQPRRIAARMLADRVAAERGGRPGEEVGYQIRFESRVSANTRIRFVTEGILMRKLIQSPDLRGISAIVFDEFHERHYFSDITLARCLQVQEGGRPDLKLVVMSATLETQALLEYLGADARHIVSAGRTFPVNILYQPPKERHKGELWDHIARALKEQFHREPSAGHVLIFLPGRYEIQKTVATLSRLPWLKGWDLHELHGEQPPQSQDAAVRSGGRPKIIVATNVAETSITIDGVTTVVDSGLERRASFDHRRGVATLLVEKISQASADQRAGRAGRTAPGTAIRLWSERDHSQRVTATPAEIHRMNLMEVVLLLKASGVEDLEQFPWLEAPQADRLATAMRKLRELGALDGQGRITPAGRQISEAPVAPHFARILLEAVAHGQEELFALVIALIQGRPLFPKQKKHSSHLMPEDFVQEGDFSDFQSLLRAWEQMRQNQFRPEVGQRLGIHAGAAREVERTAQQLLRVAARWQEEGQGKTEAAPGDCDAGVFARILLAGFSDQVALRHSPASLACSVVDQRKGQLEKSSLCAGGRDLLFLAAGMVEVEGRDLQVKLSLATRLEPAWLQECFPGDFSESSGVRYDEVHRRIESRAERRFRDLVLESRPGEAVDPDQAASLLAEKVQEGSLPLKAWDEKVEAWICRVNLVHQHCPELGVSAIDDIARRLILEQICHGATSYKEIKDRPVWSALHAYLPSYERSLVEQQAPETLRLSNGREARVHYRTGEKPRISVLIQHIFGLKDSPVICQGRLPVAVEILAPNHRPVQVTEQLADFWQGSYPAVRSQLRGRYPKHAWPEF